MDVLLPVADLTVHGAGLVLLGVVIGFLSGLFGVGGGFLLTPMLNVLFGVPYNVAVGSSLALILGTSVSATLQHRRLGNVDYALGGWMGVGALMGVEIGARMMQVLKHTGTIRVGHGVLPAADLYVSAVYMALLLSIGTIIFRESRASGKRARNDSNPTEEVNAKLVAWVHRIPLPPFIALPRSGIPQISLWVLWSVGLTVGILAGFLGIGGGFVLMPVLIYAIGVPTTTAIGTSLFQFMFSSFFGTLTHAVKGNVDLVLVVILLVGSTVGAQMGTATTRRITGARLRYYFSMIVYTAAMVVIAKLLVNLGII